MLVRYGTSCAGVSLTYCPLFTDGYRQGLITRVTREYIDFGIAVNPAAGIWVKADPNARKNLFYHVRRGTDLAPSATHKKAGNVGRWVVGEENQYELHVALGAVELSEMHALLISVPVVECSPPDNQAAKDDDPVKLVVRPSDTQFSRALAKQV